MTPKFSLLNIEEVGLVFPFAHMDQADLYACPDAFYASELIGKVPHEQVISQFIREVLDEYFYTDITYISQDKAFLLLRQMAMSGKNNAGERKQFCTSSEAKAHAATLMNFLGAKAEFYTNALSVDNPHDNPGTVMSSDSECTFKSICLFVISENRFLFISQYW